MMPVTSPLSFTVISFGPQEGFMPTFSFFGLKYFLVARRHGVARFKAEHLNVRCAETVSIARAVYRNVTAADYHNITGE